MSTSNEGTLSWFCSQIQIDSEEISALYLYGSRMYGTAHPDSDWDCTIVLGPTRTRPSHLQSVEFSTPRIDANIFLHEEFLNELRENSVRAIVSVFVPSRGVIKESFPYKTYFKRDLVKFRIAFSTISSKAVGCAKIQFEKEKNIEKCKKDIVHAYRYTLLGIQLLETGKINDFECANEFAKKVFSTDFSFFNSWKQIKAQFQHDLEQVGREFREHPQNGPKPKSKKQEIKERVKGSNSKGRKRMAEIVQGLSESVIVQILSHLESKEDLFNAARVSQKWASSVAHNYYFLMNRLEAKSLSQRLDYWFWVASHLQ